MTEQPRYSDSAQLAAIRVAKDSIDRNHGLSAGEREYHKRVLDCVADRIEDAMKRKAQQRGERQS